jgi:uncharacterized protein YbjT (DUF2867 family)
MILVVGATGEVGSEVVRLLVGGERPVRAFVRPGSRCEHLERMQGVEVVFGDLLEPDSIAPAVAGVDTIIATANTVAPRPPKEFGRVEGEGYPALIRAAQAAGCRRFVFLSTTDMGAWDERLPMQLQKRAVEREIIGSGMEYGILRFPKFADVWLALPGSSIPLRGSVNSTLGRPYWFMKVYRALTGKLVERFGLMLITAPARQRNTFVTVHDVARFLITAVDHDAMRDRVVEIGGAEVLTWAEVADLYGAILGRRVRVVRAPLLPFKVMAKVLAPFDGAAANLLLLNVAEAQDAEASSGEELAKELGVFPLETVEEFLRARA